MRYILTVLVLMFMNFAGAQDVSLALQKEPSMSEVQKNTDWNRLNGRAMVSFVNSNRRYAQDRVPTVEVKNAETLVAWKGEKVQAQLAVWTAANVDVAIIVSDLKTKNGASVSKENIKAGFVGYVLTDEFRNGCGQRKPQDFDSSLVADAINFDKRSGVVLKNQVQPIWISVEVPVTAKAGSYEATLKVRAGTIRTLKLTVNVLDRTLPESSQWAFNLDLWQHPAAVARVHQVPLWSDAHFDLMRNYYSMLANAGQKCITAGIVNEPWGHQTFDDYPSLIKWTRKKDGTWSFDYSLFDKYIAFVMSTGIKDRINCYSMVPWKVAFQYYDENLGRDTVFTGKIGSDAYNAFWTPMLKDFTRHLKQKGWFEKTTIAMDERPMDAMQSVIRLLKAIDKDWKIALAGDYHPEIEKDIYDYCIASAQQFPADVLDQRRKTGKLSTWYTCCVEKYPNGFTFSPPAEHVWIAWYTAAKNMDGYLRWAYNSWVEDPLTDSRFRSWPAGDTYQVYPGPLSSIRFEKLMEGIQDFEKIAILRKEYQQKGAIGKLNRLETALKDFEIKALEKQTAEDMVMNVKQFINE